MESQSKVLNISRHVSTLLVASQKRFLGKTSAELPAKKSLNWS